ncbi:5-methylthioadenosine/S-adenosylhomocysteine deaminase [Nakamurella sp. UYEF19]|uniref:amidohydrolase family protein n=1 Tax=Nakamurella sp. UYEF19 TaxID=1756392 RepID=UPI003399AD21
MIVLFTSVCLYDPAAPDTICAPTDVLVSGIRIVSIGAGAEQKYRAEVSENPTTANRVIQGNGHHVLLPGLINGHFHSPANHLKGSLPSLPLEEFMLYESPADPALTPTPREAYLRTMLAAIEMLRTGTTSVQDDAFLMPYPTPEIIDAVMSAYADSGIRASVALDQPELPEIDKLPFRATDTSPALRRALEAPAPMDRIGLLEAYGHLISAWHDTHHGRLTAAVSISAPQRVSEQYFGEIDDLSRAHHLPLFAHMLETKVQRTLALEQPRFQGRSLVRYTADLGLLSDRMNVIHAVWTDDADLDLIAEAGSVIAHNPVSNLRLGSGVMPFRRVRDRGISTCLGVDEAICDDSVNMWGVVKMAGLIHNITGSPSHTWPAATEVLDCLWSGGAAAMLRSDSLGKVREGYLADLTMLDLHTLPFTPFNDLAGQLVYCQDGNSVRLTMVAGEVVVENGKMLTVDEDALLAEAREVFARRRPQISAARRESDSAAADYQAMVQRAAGTDVGMSRWVNV